MGKEAPCVIINCGDGHDGHHGHHGKKDCCGPCDAAKTDNAYAGGVDLGALSPVGVEIPAALLMNPAGSGKNIVVSSRHMAAVGSDDENVLFRFYFDPAVAAPGAAVPIANLNAGGAAGVAQLYSAPAIVGNGTLIDVFNVATGEESSATLVLGEGHSLLVTERANAENSRAAATIYWSECRKRHDHDDETPPV